MNNINEIKIGEGAVIEIDGGKAAVYRKTQNQVIKLSPVCPHSECRVVWNGADKTWDCPCHGSRFDAEGHMIHGPAKKDLEKIE